MPDREGIPSSSPDPSRSLLCTINTEGRALSPSNPKDPPTPASIGLSSTRTCTDADDVLSVVAPFFQERFALSDEQTANLQSQLAFYFSKCGITNEEMLSVMTSPDS